ncbi:MAG: hypothetical protein J6W60_05810, partial [Treponema sp.]|nr:hypothetical protein [Treponema sp.]
MNNIAQKRQNYRRFLISVLLILISSISVFAQSVKPYKLDLSKFPASNENKTITFNKKTGKVTIDKHGDVRETVSLFYWINNMDVSDYNVISIKYDATEGIGFSLHVSYPEEADSYTWYERGIYCPSYLTEMVF